MHIEWKLRFGSDGLNHGWSEGEVGYEVSVHDVHMCPISASRFDVVESLIEMSEVCREDRGSNDGSVCHAESPLSLCARSGYLKSQPRSRADTRTQADSEQHEIVIVDQLGGLDHLSEQLQA